jgi:hypothetical protein
VDEIRVLNVCDGAGVHIMTVCWTMKPPVKGDVETDAFEARAIAPGIIQKASDDGKANQQTAG